MRKIVVGISGASGSIYGIRLLEALNRLCVESHVVISDWAGSILEEETAYTLEQVKGMASVLYGYRDMHAAIASGSFLHDGMIIAPCSMKTVAAIHGGFHDSLLTRAADVTLKEGRKLVLLPRETPLSPIHLRNLHALSMMGVCVMPPVPAFYCRPKTIIDLVDQTIFRALDQVGVSHGMGRRWEG